MLLCLVQTPPRLSAPQWQTPRLWANVKSGEINESSGLAPSRIYPGEFLTHNDSGDSARFFRVNSAGEVTGQWLLAEVRATDWEDMATFRWGRENWVVLADVGDNGRRRPSVQVHFVKEPRQASSTLPVAMTLDLKYPDRAHDCEAIFLDPQSGTLFLVTKAAGESGIYGLDKAAQLLTQNRSQRLVSRQLEKLATIPIETPGIGGRLITGGDMSSDGKWVVLRTYREGLVYEVPRQGRKWWDSKPIRLKLPDERQGEAICFDLSSQSLLSSSEGVPCPISEMRRQPNR